MVTGPQFAATIRSHSSMRGTLEHAYDTYARTVTPMPPLTLGPHTVWPPVVLAPMAGITNVAFRRLCREQGAGLYVCEMVTTRALVERNPKTLRMVAFARGRAAAEPAAVRRRPATIAARPCGWSSTRTSPTTSTSTSAARSRRSPARVAAPRCRGGAGSSRRLVRAAVEAAGPRHPGHRQDAQGHRRRPPDLRRSRAAPPRTPASPRSPCTGGRPPSATRAPPTGTRSPRSSRRSTCRCSATATSGKPTTRCG